MICYNVYNSFWQGRKKGIRCTLLHKKILFSIGFLAFLFTSIHAAAQVPLEKVAHLATKEIYNIHVDNKGYLWIAHALGISRYDGLNFIQFTNSEIMDLGMTDIVEDSRGRIWCHNFTGQIFYIEQGKLNLLRAYDYKKENQTPHMVICGDELLITSESGLFICSIATLKSRYIALEKVTTTPQSSIAVNGNKAIIFRNNTWYAYQNKSGIKKLTVDDSIEISKGSIGVLQPSSYKDTIFLITNPSGTLQKLVLEKNTIKLVGKTEYGDYINSVAVDRNVYVNMRNKSIALDTTLEINNYNITDVVTGKEGNTWYSSLKEGLLVNYQPSKWKKIKFPIDKEDFVRSINVSDGYFFAGTQKGNLLVMKSDSGKAFWKQNLYNGYGSIDFIRFFKKHLFIVGTPTNTYIVNPLQKKMKDELPLKAITDVDFDENSLYLATSNGFYVLPYFDSSISLLRWKNEKQLQFPFYQWNQSIDNPYLVSPQRSQAISFEENKQSLFVSTKNGLQQLSKQGIRPFDINGKEVSASSLLYKNSRLYIATINDGLWIKQRDSLEHFTTANYLFSNTILRIKGTGDHLWLLEDKGIQAFDSKSDRVLQIDLPKIAGADVFDVAEKNGYAYLTTAEGIYKVPIKGAIEKRAPAGYLDYVIVNNEDTLTGGNTRLPYDKNDLQFFFSSPAFYNPEAVTFKYRLIGDDAHWQSTKSSERMLRFSSLPPGEYTFEAKAITKNGLLEGNAFSFRFTIMKSWWTNWWFILLVNIIFVAIVYLVIRSRADQRLKVELIRRGIASDLHDDIGATLSSINIYAEMAQEELGENELLGHIQQNVHDTISRLDDLVWSINPKNDTMGQLVHRMQYMATIILEAAGVQCHFNYHKKILETRLKLNDKRDLYLLFKEMVNNVVKHAQCRNCYMGIEYDHSRLILTVRDDGIGFDVSKVEEVRNGLENMRYRAGRMNGTIHIDSRHKKGTNITVHIKA